MAAPEKNLNREEVAAIEIGRTDINRGLAGLLGVLFVGLIALVPLLQHLLLLRLRSQYLMLLQLQLRYL